MNITVVVLAGPHKSTVGLDGVGYEVVDEAMFVPNLEFIKLLFVGGLVNFLEDIFKATVVLFKDSVFGRKI